MIPRGEFALFKDRHDAGKQLAQRLLHYKGAKDTIVIALPRGSSIGGVQGACPGRVATHGSVRPLVASCRPHSQK